VLQIGFLLYRWQKLVLGCASGADRDRGTATDADRSAP